MKAKHKKVLRICSKIMFGVYIIFLFYFLFFAESMGRSFEGRTYHYNLVLFKEISRFIVHRQNLGVMAVSLNLFGNMAAFIPFGVILPIMHRRFRSLLYMTFLTFEFSLIIETFQLLLKVGSFDVDDILLNTVGGILGYLIFAVMDKIRRHGDEKKAKRE